MQPIGSQRSLRLSDVKIKVVTTVCVYTPHGNLVLKEFLSHTLKNKVYFLIFLVFHDNNIQKRIKTKKIDEATPCLGDVVDSRAVVGLGERTLHLAPGAVIMYANGATTEDFRESEVLWWVLLDDYFADFREKKSPEGCMGSGSSTISQQHFWLPEGLNVCEPGHH